MVGLHLVLDVRDSLHEAGATGYARARIFAGHVIYEMAKLLDKGQSDFHQPDGRANDEAKRGRQEVWEPFGHGLPFGKDSNVSGPMRNAPAH